jgi:hypothetical protein
MVGDCHSSHAGQIRITMRGRQAPMSGTDNDLEWYWVYISSDPDGSDKVGLGTRGWNIQLRNTWRADCHAHMQNRSDKAEERPEPGNGEERHSFLE